MDAERTHSARWETLSTEPQSQVDATVCDNCITVPPERGGAVERCPSVCGCKEVIWKASKDPGEYKMSHRCHKKSLEQGDKWLSKKGGTSCEQPNYLLPDYTALTFLRLPAWLKMKRKRTYGRTAVNYILCRMEGHHWSPQCFLVIYTNCQIDCV